MTSIISNFHDTGGPANVSRHGVRMLAARLRWWGNRQQGRQPTWHGDGRHQFSHATARILPVPPSRRFLAIAIYLH
eukprot:6181657-Pleurochrysis_carterae.AAC.3